MKQQQAPQQQQQTPQKRSKKFNIYPMFLLIRVRVFNRLDNPTLINIAKWTWIVTFWFWTTVIVTFLVSIMSTFFSATGLTFQTFQTTLAYITFHWLYTGHPKPIEEFWRWFAICAMGFVVGITIAAFAFQKWYQHKHPEGLDKIIELIDVLNNDIVSPQLDKLSEKLEQQLQKHDTLIEKQETLIKKQVTITPLLDELNDQVEQQLQKQETLIKNQDALIKALTDIHAQLQQNAAAASHLQHLDTSSQQQLQKQDALINALTDIHALLQQNGTVTSHLQHLDASSQQQIHLQEKLYQALQNAQNSTSRQLQYIGDLYKKNGHERR